MERWIAAGAATGRPADTPAKLSHRLVTAELVGNARRLTVRTTHWLGLFFYVRECAGAAAAEPLTDLYR